MRKLITLFTMIAMASLPLGAQSAQHISDKIPSLGAASTIMPWSQERDLGRAWLAAFRQQAPISEEPMLINYVEYLVYHLKSYADMQDYELEVAVVNNPSINAFAVPGGVIGINTGILLYTTEEAQLASIIAHELAHISQRHFARSNSHSSTPMLAGILTGIIAIAAGQPDAGMAAIAASQAIAVDKQLAYSRQYEREADRTGLQLMADAGYNPEAAANMFKIMLDQSRLNRNKQYDFFRTHPVVESRVADMRTRALTLTPSNAKKPSSDFEYMKALAMRDQFDNARAAVAFFEGLPNTPENRFGLAHAYLDNRQFDNALSTIQPLRKSDPDRIILGITEARSLGLLQRYEEAEVVLRDLYTYYPRHYPIRYELANILEKRRKFEEAKQLLQRLSYERPQDPLIWYQLAEVAGLANDISQVHIARAEYFRWMGNYPAAERQLLILLEDDNAESAYVAKAEQILAELADWQEKIML